MGSAPAKSGGSGKYIAIGCGVLLLLCCVTTVVYQVVCGGFAAMVAATNPGAVPSAPAPAPAAGGGGGGVCARATECCQAYIAAMPAAAGGTNCTLYGTLAGGPGESGCQSAIDGFRSGLTALGQAVPAACQ